MRVTFALVCLILTKLASVYLPFILKDLVDTLEKGNTETLILVPFGLVAAWLTNLTLLFIWRKFAIPYLAK